MKECYFLLQKGNMIKKESGGGKQYVWEIFIV
jgi:hypothetical protein